MATFIDKSVTVNVFRSDRPVSQEGLEIPLVLIPHNLSTNDVDSFISTDSVTEFDFAVNSPAYNFATGLFSGIASPSTMKIGRLTLTTIDMTVTSAPVEDTVVSINTVVNGVSNVASYTVQSGDTKIDIADGLIAALEVLYPAANTSNPTFENGSGTLDVITVTAGTVNPYSYSFGWQTFENLQGGVTQPHVEILEKTSDSLVTRLGEIRDLDDDFFFLMAESHADSDISALASYAESNDLMYFTSTDSADAKDVGSVSNIAITLKSAAYGNTSMQWSAQAGTRFPESATIGGLAGIQPYNLNSLNLRTLVGISPDQLTSQERSTLAGRNVNYYRTERDVGTYREGWVSSGAFVDTSRFALWLKFAIGASVFGTLKRESDLGRGVPYSDAGARRMESVVYNDVISLGIRGGTIADGYSTDPETGRSVDLSPFLDFKTRAQQTNANIAIRDWADAEIEVVYISPVHHVKINAYVVLNREPV